MAEEQEDGDESINFYCCEDGCHLVLHLKAPPELKAVGVNDISIHMPIGEADRFMKRLAEVKAEAEVLRTGGETMRGGAGAVH